jgi:hypothetical protein
MHHLQNPPDNRIAPNVVKRGHEDPPDLPDDGNKIQLSKKKLSQLLIMTN